MFYLLFAMSFLRKKGKSKKQELTLREKGKEISGNKRGKSSVSQTGASDHIYVYVALEKY